MLYEVITIEPVEPVVKYEPTFAVSDKISVNEDEKTVITSYSIHYTKLYEGLRETVKKVYRAECFNNDGRERNALDTHRGDSQPAGNEPVVEYHRNNFV